MVQENKPSFRRTAITEITCALEPDTVPEADLRIHDQPGAIVEVQDTAARPLEQPFSAVEPDLKEAEQMPAGLTPEEARELPTASQAPPTGWRRDDFGKNGTIRRTAYAPPWSLRPPHLEPEQWLPLPERLQADDRQKWRTTDPDAFTAQEARTLNYIRMKMPEKCRRQCRAALRLLVLIMVAST